MKIQIPKTFMGKPVEGSLEKVLAGLNANTANPPDTQTQPPINAPDLQGYIYVPSINLYVAKQRTHQGLNWYNAHEELQKQNLKMPTIPQFIEFLKFLQNGYSDRNEAQAILNEITEVRSPWRAEWLDARFENIAGEMFYNFDHEVSNSQITNRKSEKLEPCLMKDKLPGIDLNDWLNNATKQGLPNPKTKKGKLYYWYPRDTAVARFDAYSGRAGFGCGRYPDDVDALLGVRASMPAGMRAAKI